MIMSAKDTVVAAATMLFGEKDPSAVTKYFGPTYTQHSTMASDGIEGLSQLANNVPVGFDYEIIRSISEGDLVLVQGVYTGIVDHQLVAFDVYRAAHGRVVEHWDSLTPRLADTADGRSQISGPTGPVDLEKTGENKALVTEFTERVLVGSDFSNIENYISSDSFTEHNLESRNGIEGFRAKLVAWTEPENLVVYTKLHQVIAEGDFVFTRAAGQSDGPVMLNDLWRIEDGKIVEHWYAIDSIPAELPHSNGVF